MAIIRDHLTAGYPGLWVITQEPHRAEEVLAADSRGKCEPFAWDSIRGIRKATNLKVEESVRDPIDAILWLNDRPDTILLAHNLHMFMDSPDLKQAIQNGMQIWKSRGSCLCIIGPSLVLPPEIEKMFFALDLPLPEESHLHQIQTELSQHEETSFEIVPAASAAARGLTAFEAETAFAYSIATKGKFDPLTVSRAKAQMLKKTGFLEFWPPEDPAMVGGLGEFKKWLAPRLEAFLPDSTKPPPRALLFVGIPGTGKSLVSKAIAAMIQRDLIRFDITATKDSLVGESERRTRQATQVIDAFGQSVVWIDEIEKALGGAVASARTGDVTGNQLGILLTWMQESKSQVLIAATANSVEALPPELLRRFDEVFFVDVPYLKERREIIEIMNRKWGTTLPLELAERLSGYTGAEIEKLAKSSIFEPFEVGLQRIVPITKTSKETIEALRVWAAGAASPANTPDQEDEVQETRRLKL